MVYARSASNICATDIGPHVIDDPCKGPLREMRDADPDQLCWAAGACRLGVMVRRLVFQQEDMALADPERAEGWWAAEHDGGCVGRWAVPAVSARRSAAP